MRSRRPCPVFGIAGFLEIPEEQDLIDGWALDQLVVGRPALRERGQGSWMTSLADPFLLDAGLIVPLLDGLDEIPGPDPRSRDRPDERDVCLRPGQVIG